ncbi:L,D-transpeptidase family protein [Hyphomicrobium facile]|uniref:L,D-transpeptidase catalytic domain n=1 Tax=Hyphomicrobium facile TaxID=51670 RepID=A0A1I7MW66_9HYPH|nr:L,D-transpeptidase family protein [Hyphomicrobium facile]SFV26652.1 L,D-transpeptidase catalytic domain [Hyphomicrobium facile]
MSLRFLSGLTLSAMVMAGGLMSASSAKADDLIDFLWGGSAEYGGGRKIVSFDPKYKPGQVIVSFSDRRLYWITKPGEAMTYPVAVPKEGARWQGVTSVTNKRVNPPWTPTPEMVSKNPRLPRWVPGGHPMNPLGIRAMYLGSSTYRIHGTDAPWTIGQAVSAGCIRMTNEDVLDLYPRVPMGTRVTVTWQQFSTQPLASGDKYPRYGDADSNPRAASASSASANSAPKASASASSSNASTYEYKAYNTGKAQNARAASTQSNDYGLNSDFWDEKPTKSASVSQAAPEAQDQASQDATQDDDLALTQKSDPQQRDAEKAPKQKAAEAKSETEPSASASAEKKKISDTSSASSAKKKATSSSVSDPHVDPVMSPAMAVPDPVKPSAVSAPAKESDSGAATTRASASEVDGLPVHKAAAVQVQ